MYGTTMKVFPITFWKGQTRR